MTEFFTAISNNIREGVKKRYRKMNPSRYAHFDR